MMPSETSEEPIPTEMTDVWRYTPTSFAALISEDALCTCDSNIFLYFSNRYDESDKCWNGILREISYAEGSTVLHVRLNTVRLTKL